VAISASFDAGIAIAILYTENIHFTYQKYHNLFAIESSHILFQTEQINSFFTIKNSVVDNYYGVYVYYSIVLYSIECFDVLLY